MRMLLASMNNAFEAGRRVGILPEGSAIDCPIDHTQLMMRLIWMDGFSKGRCVLSKAGDWSELPIWQ